MDDSYEDDSEDGEGKIPHVAMLYTTAGMLEMKYQLSTFPRSLPGDQRHRNVSLNPVNPRPRRDKSKDSGNQIDQCCCWVALISTCLPQFV